MSATTGPKIIEQLSAFPEEDREAVERGVLNYMDWLAEMKAGLARSEADIDAGRVKLLEEVADRLRGKYASEGHRHRRGGTQPRSDRRLHRLR